MFAFIMMMTVLKVVYEEWYVDGWMVDTSASVYHWDMIINSKTLWTVRLNFPWGSNKVYLLTYIYCRRFAPNPMAKSLNALRLILEYLGAIVREYWINGTQREAKET